MWSLNGLLGIAAILLALLTGKAEAAFDPTRYEPAELDVIAARKPPLGNGVDVFPARPYRFNVTLVAQATPCSNYLLRWAMKTSGIADSEVQDIPISHCITVKSAKGKVLSLFIQDVLAESLAKEVQPNGKLTLYTTLIYFDQQGPGIIVNEFAATPANEKASNDCGCGRDSHSGIDYGGKAGRPVPVGTDGTVVKVEDDEQAKVDIPSAGYCGRYVVIKHTFPNGRVAFSRFTHLGKLTDKAGKPISAGLQVRRGDRIGEVGSRGLFHFEFRPVDTATMDNSEGWTKLYGADPGMEWSRYGVVDPAKFEAKAFGGKTATPAGKK